MILISRKGKNEVLDEKANMILTLHYEAVVNDKRLYRKIGVNLADHVTLRGGQTVTVQQAI